MTRILGISGSLRERSYNTALLRAAAELAPPDVELEIFDLSEIPLYNDDVEAVGDPEPVARLRAAVAEADALLIATPEYNRGTSGVLKNAIDWLSRPALASVLRWKPVAIMGASSGRGGTRRAQQQVRDALDFPGAVVVEAARGRDPGRVGAVRPGTAAHGRGRRRGRHSSHRGARRFDSGAVAVRGCTNGGVRAEHGIEAESLVRTFKGDITAVDGIDLRVEPGEIYGFLGPNGAGKSTTVHMLTTLLPPTSGTARVAGFDIVREGPNVRSAIGAALQEAALDNLLTGREHLRLQCALHGISRSERKVRSQELLERVGLTLAADRKVGGYSGGMKRRLDLALALAHRPTILFLDEPTTGLDPQSRSALWGEVARLAREEGVTVFLTTQYLEEADALADRVGIIDHGKIVAEGTPEQLKAQIGRSTVEAVPADGTSPEAMARILEQFGERTDGSPKSVAVRLEHGVEDLAGIVRALDAEGIKIEHLELHAPSLDDVFLAKTGRSLEGAAEEEEAEAEAEAR